MVMINKMREWENSRCHAHARARLTDYCDSLRSVIYDVGAGPHSWQTTVKSKDTRDVVEPRARAESDELNPFGADYSPDEEDKPPATVPLRPFQLGSVKSGVDLPDGNAFAEGQWRGCTDAVALCNSEISLIIVWGGNDFWTNDGVWWPFDDQWEEYKKVLHEFANLVKLFPHHVVLYTTRYEIWGISHIFTRQMTKSVEELTRCGINMICIDSFFLNMVDRQLKKRISGSLRQCRPLQKLGRLCTLVHYVLYDELVFHGLAEYRPWITDCYLTKMASLTNNSGSQAETTKRPPHRRD